MSKEEFDIIKEIKKEEAEEIYKLLKEDSRFLGKSILPSLDDSRESVYTVHLSNSTDSLACF